MPPQPLYTPANVHDPAYHLRYTWTGWPSHGTFPVCPPAEFFTALDECWEGYSTLCGSMDVQ